MSISLPASMRVTRASIIFWFGLSGVFTLISDANAGISLLQPARVMNGNTPFTLVLLVAGEEQQTQRYLLPDRLSATITAEMVPSVQLQLQRDPASPAELTLQPGQFRKVRYSAPLPAHMRGLINIDVVDMNTSSMQVAVIRPHDAAAPVPGADRAATAGNVTQSASGDVIGIAPAPVTMADLNTTPRLSFHEPVYFIAGRSGGNRNAKFQLSFKFRLFQPDDMRSRGLMDNLYFGYTQYSLWDLQSPSAPFRDTNYRPSLFYYLPDLGWHSGLLTRTAAAAGLEHESNGRAGPDSRSLNIFFVEPTFVFGSSEAWQLRISPKMYTYLGPTSDNPDIGQYRGHADLKMAVGKTDGIALSTTLRKGTRSNAFSAVSMLTYPLARLIPGTAGYLSAGYFYGYGESLLTYSQKQTPQLRFGYSLRR